ncbi:hypothetical protein, conserved [Thermococcus kodakarensis KOD1]|uniref:Uncharacterized protein n=1 Tax=Thermococcus kodakarensis (strain ATCC BAA-918 / JCM 12380 / KOD1) TaxID=69014 RepID=Q5JDK1_THEKO|nr:hypothetical protein, conserved [Thermococcus kodakarensis KOD1]
MESWVIYMLIAWAVILGMVYWSVSKLLSAEKEAKG